MSEAGDNHSSNKNTGPYEDSPALEALLCPQCGADLDVPDGIQTLRCRYCGTSLRLKESGNVRGLAIIEKKLGEVIEATEHTAKRVDEIEEEQRRPLAVWQERRDQIVSKRDRRKAEAGEKWERETAPYTSELEQLRSQLGQCSERHDQAKTRAAGNRKLGTVAIIVIPAGIAVPAIALAPSPDLAGLIVVASLIITVLIRAVVVGSTDKAWSSAYKDYSSLRSRVQFLDNQYRVLSEKRRRAIEEAEAECARQLEAWDKRKPL